MKVNGPWEVLTPTTLTIAPGAELLDVQVKFIAQNEPPHSYNETNGTFNPNYGGAWTGSLSIETNDPNNVNYVEQLAGWWQYQSEASMEPEPAEPDQPVGQLQDGDQSHADPRPCRAQQQGDVLRPGGAQRLLEGRQSECEGRRLFQLASWHIQGNSATTFWTPSGEPQRARNALFDDRTQQQGQTLLPTTRRLVESCRCRTHSRQGTGTFSVPD